MTIPNYNKIFKSMEKTLETFFTDCLRKNFYTNITNLGNQC